MRFKEGDRVRIIKGEDSVEEINGGLGMEGVITSVDEYDCICAVDSDDFVNYDSWLFRFEQLELITEPTVPVSSSCPRCSGEMVEKQTVDYGTIKKCKGCGYC